MNKISAVAGVVFVLATCWPGVAWSQIPQYTTGPQTGTGGPSLRRSTRPVVSPYTSLLNSGVGSSSSVGQQYFNLVQPTVRTNRALRTLGQSVNRLQAYQQAGSPFGLSAQQQLLTQQGGGLSSIGPTGHPTGYFSHTMYFGTNLQRGGTGGTSGTPTPPSVSGAGPSTATPVRR